MANLRWTPALLMVCALGSLAGSLNAQEFAPARIESRINLLQDRKTGIEASMAIYGRLSGIAGVVDSDLDVNYNDLFGSGLGFVMEGEILGRVGRAWMIGGYLSVGWDSFDGKSDVDSVGDTLTPDRMDLLTILVGFKAINEISKYFHWDLHVGLGAAHYGKVDGVFVTGGAPLDVTVFKASTAFAFDFGARIAVDSGPFFAALGMSIRVQGAPSNADFDFGSRTPAIVAFELGIGVRF
jgi:hypothetical protein